MPYQPTFPYPYLEGIDVSKENNVFKCLINPRDEIVGYKITILSNRDGLEVANINSKIINGVQVKNYQLTEQDTRLPLKGSSKEDTWLNVSIPKLSSLVNGQEYKWNITLYEEIPSIKITDCAIGTYTKYNEVTTDGYLYYAFIYGYTSEIKPGMFLKCNNQYNEILAVTDNGSYISVGLKDSFIVEPTLSTTDKVYSIYENNIKSPDYFFYANSTPEINFELSKVESAYLNIQVNYSQAEYVPISYYIFNLYHNSKLINSTGEVYSSNINYSYFGLQNNTEYTLELTVVDTVKRSYSFSQDFLVKYTTFETYAIPKLNLIKEKTCVNIDVSNNAVIPGTLENSQDLLLETFKQNDGITPETTNAIKLKNQSLYWDTINNETLNIPDDSTIVINWHGKEGFQGIIFKIYNQFNPAKNIIVGFDGFKFYYQIGLNNIVEVDPFSDIESAIFNEGETIIVDESTIYIINEEDVILGTDTLVSNDITNNNWWNIIVLPTEVRFIKVQNYEESVVI